MVNFFAARLPRNCVSCLGSEPFVHLLRSEQTAGQFAVVDRLPIGDAPRLGERRGRGGTQTGQADGRTAARLAAAYSQRGRGPAHVPRAGPPLWRCARGAGGVARSGASWRRHPAARDLPTSRRRAGARCRPASRRIASFPERGRLPAASAHDRRRTATACGARQARRARPPDGSDRRLTQRLGGGDTVRRAARTRSRSNRLRSRFGTCPGYRRRRPSRVACQRNHRCARRRA